MHFKGVTTHYARMVHRIGRIEQIENLHHIHRLVGCSIREMMF